MFGGVNVKRLGGCTKSVTHPLGLSTASLYNKLRHSTPTNKANSNVDQRKIAGMLPADSVQLTTANVRKGLIYIQ